MSAESDETMNPVQPPKDNRTSRTIRFMLARLLSLLIPGSGECRKLTTEEEIIACMAKRHPTMFIT